MGSRNELSANLTVAVVFSGDGQIIGQYAVETDSWIRLPAANR